MQAFVCYEKLTSPVQSGRLIISHISMFSEVYVPKLLLSASVQR